MSIVFLVMWVVSIAFSAVIGLAAITYIRRTWQLIRLEDDDPTRDRLLDGMDHLENQMHLVAERLGGLEAQLSELDARLGGPQSHPALPDGNARDSSPEASPTHSVAEKTSRG